MIGTVHNTLHHVRVDDFHGGKLATQHLIDLGHSQIGLISDYIDTPWHFVPMRERFRGYQDALSDNGMDFRPELTAQGPHGRDEACAMAINLLTLLAIVLSVGLVVDDAIIVVENIERHIREGLAPFDAAIVGARELVGPIIAMTITLAAVYAPIGLQGGLTGALFREFAFTLAGAVTISGIVALTLSPMMSAKLLKPGLSEHGLAGRISRGFERLKELYGRLLDQTLAARPAVYLVWLVISLLTIPMFKMSATELAPAEDQGVIFGIVDAAANSTLEQTSHYTALANEVFLSEPETEFTFQVTLPSSGFSGMVTKPWFERERTVFEILPDIQKKLGVIPGIQIMPVIRPSLPGGGQYPVYRLAIIAVGVLVALAMAGQLLILIWARGSPNVALAESADGEGSNTRLLGESLYTDFLYPFEIAGIILLVAIVAAIMLTHRRREQTKYQDPARQVSIRRDERIRLVSMESERLRNSILASLSHDLSR